MRKNLLHIWHKELSYEIREVVEIAKTVESFWKKIIWENIWDPIVKGEHIPNWMKNIIQESLKKDEVYAYSHSKWLEKTREYLAEKNGKISPEDIIFFNGLWEAINKIYGYIEYSARVIWPNPAYPTHSSAEATNSGSEHLTYRLNPNNNWNPDVEEIRNKVKYNPNITGILVINPDNPTGAVFKREILEEIIQIAKEYDLFVIFDEIYEKLTFDKNTKISLRDIIGDVPGISMKWISKELPWPWARCGRIEIYNREKDKNFSEYINSIFMSKMLEVCSTTLPQYVIPEIYENPEFQRYIDKRVKKYSLKADITEEVLWDLEEIHFVKPKGAYYVGISFNMEKINTNFTPEIKNPELQKYIEKQLEKTKRFDKKFCYYMLAETGICSVALSWFNSTYEWFRFTLLEEDIDEFRKILETIKNYIKKWKN